MEHIANLCIAVTHRIENRGVNTRKAAKRLDKQQPFTRHQCAKAVMAINRFVKIILKPDKANHLATMPFREMHIAHHNVAQGFQFLHIVNFPSVEVKAKDSLTSKVVSIISMSKGVSHPAYPWQQFSNLSVVVHDLVRAPYAHAPYGSCHAMPWHSHEPSPTGGHQAESQTVATLSIWHRTCSRCLAVFSLNSCPYRKCFWLQKGKPTTLGFVRPEQKKGTQKSAERG